MVRSSTPSYAGFKVAFAAKDVPKTSRYSTGSFKAGFTVSGSDWQVVSIPFNTFSYDWSPFTGKCDTKDPTGQQHHCCATSNSTTAGPAYCPTTAFLSTITNMEVWAEGAAGDFHLEVKWIGASDSKQPKTVCKNTEYCCPDAKHCLTPTNPGTLCSGASDCKASEVCCPITHECVSVGEKCTPP